MFDPELAEIRFGCGLSPVLEPVGSPAELIKGLTATDPAIARFPVTDFANVQARSSDLRRVTRAERDAPTEAERNAAKNERQALRLELRQRAAADFRNSLQRRIHTQTPIRERLVSFWNDHFTTFGKAGAFKLSTPAFVEDVIRPRMTSRFEYMLTEAVTHPLMLDYLDQDKSVGPNSIIAQRTNNQRGLNENLAREVLELHTLGVGGPYTQTDVHELAKLFAGMTFDGDGAFLFRERMGEPKPEIVLGQKYGFFSPRMEDIKLVLRDLARHPATARHISHKLAAWFVSETPPSALVDAMTGTWRDTDGDLSAVYETLLTHPEAWNTTYTRVKQPFDLMSSSLRALALPPDALANLPDESLNPLFLQPMRLMGQDWYTPAGPDGLPEMDAAWISPQGLAARIQWAMTVPRALSPDLPDPRSFVRMALGKRASPAVTFAADAAETRWEGVGLILSSPAFQTT